MGTKLPGFAGDVRPLTLSCILYSLYLYISFCILAKVLAMIVQWWERMVDKLPTLDIK